MITIFDPLSAGLKMILGLWLSWKSAERSEGERLSGISGGGWNFLSDF